MRLIPTRIASSDGRFSPVVNNNWGVFCTLLDIGVDPNTTNPSPTAADDTFLSRTSFSVIYLSVVVILYPYLKSLRI
jgi:hypothetical protein